MRAIPLSQTAQKAGALRFNKTAGSNIGSGYQAENRTTATKLR